MPVHIIFLLFHVFFLKKYVNKKLLGIFYLTLMRPFKFKRETVFLMGRNLGCRLFFMAGTLINKYVNITGMSPMSFILA